jgi:hypothetical protein
MLRGTFKDCSIAYSLENRRPELPEGIKVSSSSYENPVRNLDFEYIFFTDSSVFAPAAKEFNRNKELYGDGRYTNSIRGTTQYREYWDEQKRRCLEGYTVDGIRITGEHYFYLNFCLIEKTVITKDTGVESDAKQFDFPDFTLMDFYWFLELEKNEYPTRYGLPKFEKKGMIVAKARRKGWSFKNAAGLVYKFSLFKRSYCIIAAFLKEHAEATFKMCKNMLNFLDEYTEFRHPKLIDNEEYIESGWIRKRDNVKKGYRSVIQIMTFHRSGYKSVGKSCTRMIFEEAGLFENLRTAYTMSAPLFRDGTRMIGMPIIFGTGGDMLSATQGFAEIFYNPRQFGLAEYKNIYDQNATGHCGYFIDEMWFRPGDLKYIGPINGTLYQGIDKNGNPNRWASELDLLAERETLRGPNSKALSQWITQYCMTPQEAFMLPEGNYFPKAELMDRLSRLRSEDNYKYIGTPGVLAFSDSAEAVNGVQFTPDLKGKSFPLLSYRLKDDEPRDGAIVVYETPIQEEDGHIPDGLYIIGHDPYGINNDTGESLGATYVLKTNQYLKYGRSQIVAEYVGRPSGGNSMTVYNTNLEKLAQYYNAKIMFENDRGDVANYFLKRKKYHYLLDEPGATMLKAIGKRSYGRVKGCSMSNSKMISQGELYLYDWLLERRGEQIDGREILNLDLIPSMALLEELISYSREGNFDRVSAMFMAIIALEEKFNKHEEERKTVDTSQDFLLKNSRLFPNKNINANRKTTFIIQ